MEQKLEYGNSYYQFSFFNMKVDVPGDLMDLENLPENFLGLYFHEYIHYIQDVSTIYGLMSMSTTNYYIQACAHFISKIKDGNEFIAPISMETLENDNPTDFGLLNLEVKPIYLGSNINPKSKIVKDLSYRIEDFELSTGQSTSIVHAKFLNEYDEIKEFQFGGNILTEGMAYLCEQEMFAHALPKSYEYPYSIVEKFVEIIYPELIADKIAIVTLCDISLMTYHPGLSFIHILKYVRKKNLVTKIDSPIEFYKICNNYLKGSHVDFDILADNVKGEIKKSFNDKYFTDLHNWIDTLFNNVKNLRKELPFFVSGILLGGNLVENKYFNHVLDLLGSPLTLNGDGEATIRPPVNFISTTPYFHPGLFMAINQTLRIFYLDRPMPCKLIDYCSASKENDPNLVIDENCRCSPWKKAQEASLCPVGQIWYHWALKDNYPNYKLTGSV